jgi:hypothetical protein
VYNSIFREYVSSNEVVAAASPEPFIHGLTDRTFWFDPATSTFRARNLEGRLFVELLGDLRSDGLTRVPLGYELVDVSREPTPADVTIELGERLLPPAPGQLSELTAVPPAGDVLSAFAYEHVRVGSPVSSGAKELYAARETQARNDYRMHWLETGREGLQWPSLYGRYTMVWPADASRYSHYVRAQVATDFEAQATAIQLKLQEAPYIQYQDPLDQPRASLLADGRFYTRLEAAQPAHRTLLRFLSGGAIAFERVFSWLDVNLNSAARFAGNTPATHLTAWNPTNGTFQWLDPLAAPRLVSHTVNVGARIQAPESEPGGGSNYLAGHVHTAMGTAYHPGAYVDPLARGFAAANQGAIIPVNAIPGANNLEVWWFRQGNSTSGFHAGNQQQGFTRNCWPAVIGRYTLQWPASAPEIVLASRLGSGTLDADQSTGTIYCQNDPTLPGYNPNEEHAIMSGGIAYATRDDLNITNAGSGYSSHPFVLLDYQSNGVPCLNVFKVLREKPEAGYVFDFPV